MKALHLLLTATLFCWGCSTQNKTTPSTSDSSSLTKETATPLAETLPFKKDVPNAEMQIKLALLVAPPEKRDSATVYGYDADNQLVVIKQGTNELICLAATQKTQAFQWPVIAKTWSHLW